MSRIGRAPIKMPQGVELKVEGNLITVKGPLGTLTQNFDSENIGITLADGVITVTRANELNTTKAKHGLYRALLQDMVIGVTAGYQKTLIINGVGWKATQNGKDITLNKGVNSATTSANVPQAITKGKRAKYISITVLHPFIIISFCLFG